MIRFLYIFLLFFMVPSLYAQDSYRDFERGLNLSESQKARVREIRNKYFYEWRSLRRDSITKRLELRELYRNPDGNKGRTQALQQEINGIQQSRQQLYNQYRNEVSRVLNERQKQQYNSFRDTERSRIVRPLRPIEEYDAPGILRRDGPPPRPPRGDTVPFDRRRDNR
jgi:hypothetical protein